MKHKHVKFEPIKPVTIPIPTHWFKKTKANLWPIAEGVWIKNEDEENLLRIMYLGKL